MATKYVIKRGSLIVRMKDKVSFYGPREVLEDAAQLAELGPDRIAALLADGVLVEQAMGMDFDGFSEVLSAEETAAVSERLQAQADMDALFLAQARENSRRQRLQEAAELANGKEARLI
jgi:hypothetical protein